MLDVEEICRLHETTAARWHREAIDNPHEGLLGVVCEQHACNFRLWHEEDPAHDGGAEDARLAQAKRTINRLNKQRNDWIEALDEMLLERLGRQGVRPAADAPLNTETPGSAIDRLSILSLRIYHLQEILDASQPDTPRRREAHSRLTLCREQLQDLAGALSQLLQDVAAGRKRLKVHRHLKMYDDPRFNPHLAERAGRTGQAEQG